MKVYVVVYYAEFTDDSAVIGIFSSKNEAEVAIKESSWESSRCLIEEFELGRLY